jgi:ketopantoate reductase
MRYIIIGAGAVGGTIGGRLFESGHEVVKAPGSTTSGEVMALLAA